MELTKKQIEQLLNIEARTKTIIRVNPSTFQSFHIYNYGAYGVNAGLVFYENIIFVEERRGNKINFEFKKYSKNQVLENLKTKKDNHFDYFIVNLIEKSDQLI